MITRFWSLTLFAPVLLFVGCAYEGTIVRKDFRPLPFSYSLAMDGIYHFEIRDREGHVHSQLVTAATYANYRVGEYFTDFQPLSLAGRSPLGPEFAQRRAAALVAAPDEEPVASTPAPPRLADR